MIGVKSGVRGREWGGMFGRREWGGERLTVVGGSGSEGGGEDEEASCIGWVRNQRLVIECV